MKSKLTKNVTWSVAYKVLTLFIPLITTPYISRVLGADNIGIYSFEYSIVYYFIIFIMLGVENYGNRSISEVSDDVEKRSKTFWQIYIIQIINAILLTIIYLCYTLFISKEKLIGFVMLFFIVGAGLDINWLFFGLEKISITVIRNLIIKLVSFISIFLFVKDENDLLIYTLINSASVILSQLFLWLNVKKYIKLEKVNLVESYKKHFKNLWILFIPVIAVSLYRIMDKIMLGAIGGDNSEVGYYDSAERIVQLPVQIISAIGLVMMPRISNMYSKGQLDEIKKIILNNCWIVMFISSFMAFGLMAVSDLFIPLFLGPGFEKCITLMIIIMPSTIFLSFSDILRTTYLIPQKKDKIYIISILTGALINLIANSLLIPKYYSVGASIGTLLAEFAVCFVQIIFVWKYIPIKKLLSISFINILLAFIMSIVVQSIHINLLNNTILLLVKILIGVALAMPIAFIIYKKIFKGKELIE